MIDLRPRLTRKASRGAPERTNQEIPATSQQGERSGNTHSYGKSCPRVLAVDPASAPELTHKSTVNQGLERAGIWPRPHGWWVFEEETSGFASWAQVQISAQLSPSCVSLGKGVTSDLQGRAVKAGHLWSLSQRDIV